MCILSGFKKCYVDKFKMKCNRPSVCAGTRHHWRIVGDLLSGDQSKCV